MPSALVTGGASGIGLAAARTLRREGYDLTLVGRRRDALDAAATELGASVLVADLADPDLPAEVVEAHVRRCGGIDAFVAAAGNWELTPVAGLTAAAWDPTANLHVRGAALGAGAAARHMIGAGHGRIVFVSSVNGFQSEPGSVAYSAAKTAVLSLARTFAVDLGDSGVAVNAVAPGWVDTAMTADEERATTPERMRLVNPLGRFGTADEIAEVIRWLVVDAPPFLTGATIPVDGGQIAQAALP